MCENARTELWEVVFEAYYLTFYQELLALKLSKIWYLWDVLTMPVIILTTSGLAISSWTLWSEPTLKILWSVIAGIGAIAAVLRALFKPVPKHLKWISNMREFRSIRLQFEELRRKIRLDSQPIDESRSECDHLAELYRCEMLRTHNDIFLTNKLEHEIQENLNARLAGGIDNGKETENEDG